MKKLKEIIINCSRTFANGLTVVNTTPHPLTFDDRDGVIEVPCSVQHGERTGSLVLNARAVETEVRPYFVSTKFEGSPEGSALINEIYRVIPDAIIIGSIIAAQAYPGRVFGMVPAPGYERVAPAEKRMSTEKFTTFE